MTKFIIRWAINAVALYVAVLIVPGIELRGAWTGVLWLALIFGLLNALVRPLLKFLTCPLIILTLGLFTIVINTGDAFAHQQDRTGVRHRSHRGWFLDSRSRQSGHQRCQRNHERDLAR